MVKFLDQAGLAALWNKIKQTFYSKSELQNVVIHTATSSADSASYGSDIERLLNLILGEDTLTVDRVMEIIHTEETTLNAASGKYYLFEEEVNTLSIVLPEIEDNTFVGSITFSFATGINPNITFSGSNTIYKQKDFEIESNKIYEINATFNGNNWLVSLIEIDDTPLYVEEII